MAKSNQYKTYVKKFTTYEVKGMLEIVDGKFVIIYDDEENSSVNIDVETILNSIVGQPIYLKSIEELQ